MMMMMMVILIYILHTHVILINLDKAKQCKFTDVPTHYLILIHYLLSLPITGLLTIILIERLITKFGMSE